MSEALNKTIVKVTVFDPAEKVNKTVRMALDINVSQIAAVLASRAIRNTTGRAELQHGMIEARILRDEGNTKFPRRKKFGP